MGCSRVSRFGISLAALWLMALLLTLLQLGLLLAENRRRASLDSQLLSSASATEPRRAKH